MIDLLKTYIRYVLLHRFHKISKEGICFIEKNFKKKPKKGIKKKLYDKIILTNKNND